MRRRSKQEQFSTYFEEEFARARVGSEIVYHIGFTALDPVTHIKVPDARAAWKACEDGKVSLYQRRDRKNGDLHYCAKVLRK